MLRSTAASAPPSDAEAPEPKPRRSAPAPTPAPVPALAPDHVPTVSLGLPVYNGENFLAEALDSILAQTLTDFELIISDNASTDATAEICKSYAERDPRIRYIRQPRNLGAAANYNVVFHAARGRFFKWCAHDDLLSETFLEKCADWLETHDDYVGAYPADVIRMEQNSGRRRQVEHDLDPGAIDAGARFAHYLDIGPIHCGVFFALYRREALEGSGLHGAYLSSDRVFIGEMLLRGRIAQVEGTQISFREHSEQFSRKELHNQNEAIGWMDPAKHGARTMARNRLVLEYINAVRRSAPSGRDKRTALQAITRMAWSQRARLSKELLLPLYRNGRPTKIGQSLVRLLGAKR